MDSLDASIVIKSKELTSEESKQSINGKAVAEYEVIMIN